MRVVIVLEYLGKNYCGFAPQKNGISIAHTVEFAYAHLTKERITVVGASRTDAGVNALAQHIHFDTNTSIPPEKICYALNTYLPVDIRAVRSYQVDDNFHVRYEAKVKHYRYTILNRPHASAIHSDTVWHVPRKLDITAMKRQIAAFEGTHNFSAFCAAGAQSKTFVRTVFFARILEKENGLIHLDFLGNGFLYNMVRIMTGTIVAVGHNKINSVEGIIKSRDRKRAGPTAPPHGLTLYNIVY